MRQLRWLPRGNSRIWSIRAEAEAEDTAKHGSVSLQELRELHRLINEVRDEWKK